MPIHPLHEIVGHAQSRNHGPEGREAFQLGLACAWVIGRECLGRRLVLSQPTGSNLFHAGSLSAWASPRRPGRLALDLVERDRIAATRQGFRIPTSGGAHVDIIERLLSTSAAYEVLDQGALARLLRTGEHDRRHHAKARGKRLVDESWHVIHGVDDIHSRRESTSTDRRPSRTEAPASGYRRGPSSVPVQHPQARAILVHAPFARGRAPSSIPTARAFAAPDRDVPPP